MATAVTITIDGESSVPGVTEITPDPQAPEAAESPYKLIDRGPEVEVSHSSAREAIQEILRMVGRRVWIFSTLRKEGIELGFQDGVLEPVRFRGDGDIWLTLEDEGGEIYPPMKTAIDRHVEHGLVVLRSAGGHELEFHVIAGE